MKYFVKIIVVTFFLFTSTHVFSQETIAVLDMKLVLNNSKAGKNAQEYLKKKFTTNQKKFISEENNLKKEESDLLGKKADLSKEEYKKQSEALRDKVLKYQTERRSSLDKISKQRADARQQLLKKINPILSEYINENNLSLIIDKKDVLAGKSDLDITNIIIEKLNKELPSLNLK